MSAKKRLHSDPRVPLAMSKAERKLILESLTYLDGEYAEGIRSTPMDDPVRFTLDEWEGLSGCIAAEANHTRNRAIGRNWSGYWTGSTAYWKARMHRRPSRSIVMRRISRVTSNWPRCVIGPG